MLASPSVHHALCDLLSIGGPRRTSRSAGGPRCWNLRGNHGPDFHSDIIVNTNGTLTVREEFTLHPLHPGRYHDIFRYLPLEPRDRWDPVMLILPSNPNPKRLF